MGPWSVSWKSTYVRMRMAATHHKLGYTEGWYVAEDYRHHGVGKKLLAKAEDWARSHRCLEMASDAIIDNELSQRAHEALGYEVVDRCVHYRKRL